MPVVHGGAVATHRPAAGPARGEPIPCRADWVRRHLVWSFDPAGERHRVPGVLDALLGHPRARAYVARVSQLACRAASGLARGDVGQVADAVREYREVFFVRWGLGRLIHPQRPRRRSRACAASAGPPWPGSRPGPCGGANW
jgi:hypothetical protein